MMHEPHWRHQNPIQVLQPAPVDELRLLRGSSRRGTCGRRRPSAPARPAAHRCPERRPGARTACPRTRGRPGSTPAANSAFHAQAVHVTPPTVILKPILVGHECDVSLTLLLAAAYRPLKIVLSGSLRAVSVLDADCCEHQERAAVIAIRTTGRRAWWGAAGQLMADRAAAHLDSAVERGAEQLVRAFPEGQAADRILVARKALQRQPGSRLTAFCQASRFVVLRRQPGITREETNTACMSSHYAIIVCPKGIEVSGMGSEA